MTLDIQYTFTREDKLEDVFDLKLDPETITLVDVDKDNLPDWTRTEFHQCENCPRHSEQFSHCPAATVLVPVVKSFAGISSHDQVSVKVVTQERTVLQTTTAQRAIGSMMGLILAASGCPHTVFFRPMARFHLPLASEDETIFRAASMYLLAQYFRLDKGEDADFQLRGLSEIYEKAQHVNTSMAKRIRSATETDSSINAVIFLDMYAKAMPYIIKGALDEVRHLFEPYISSSFNKPL